jgi:uncharacterized membrane protein (Fun14 family)
LRGGKLVPRGRQLNASSLEIGIDSIQLLLSLSHIACFDLPVEDFLFSAGGGFLFGAIAGYAIKKVKKVTAAVAGLFVAGLAYLSYKGWIDVKWISQAQS